MFIASVNRIFVNDFHLIIKIIEHVEASVVTDNYSALKFGH